MSWALCGKEQRSFRRCNAYIALRACLVVGCPLRVERAACVSRRLRSSKDCYSLTEGMKDCELVFRRCYWGIWFATLSATISLAQEVRLHQASCLTERPLVGLEPSVYKGLQVCTTSRVIHVHVRAYLCEGVCV